MKAMLTSTSLAPKLIKITSLSLLSISIFLLMFKHLSSFSLTTTQQSHHLSFYNSSTHYAPPPTPAQSTSPPPLHTVVERTGIINEMGFMTDDFIVGEFDEELVLVVNADNNKNSNTSSSTNDDVTKVVKFEKFRACDESVIEYIPCWDNVEADSRFDSSEKDEKYERHCPESGNGLDCVVPRPKGYKLRIPWPKSRDEVWFDNVPHIRLVEDKGDGNRISRKDDILIFARGGADLYLDQISKMVPEIAFGQQTRVALEIGSEDANVAASLMERNVTVLSIAPKDVHGNHIQIALERGVPAMIASFGTRRLPYPSQAFDFIHCSKCRIKWTCNDGTLLVEANRMLRAGGYFVWAEQPTSKQENKVVEQGKEMEDLTARLCWELVKMEGYIAIWQKPLNDSCLLNRDPSVKPALCETNDNPDDIWSANVKACITRLPENGYGGNITKWPARLHSPPDRLFSIQMDAYNSRRELYKADSKYQKDIVSGYVGAFHMKDMKLRNVMDMKAGYGGFAAALVDFEINCWVMNVVPVSSSNTLPVIYDRGLIGVMHDWCEPFDTYPRTYDMLNAVSLFSVEQRRCNITNIMLEMDRILRPGGRVYIRDTTPVIDQLQEIAKAMGWVTFMFDSGEGPHAISKLLTCEKRM